MVEIIRVIFSWVPEGTDDIFSVDVFLFFLTLTVVLFGLIYNLAISFFYDTKKINLKKLGHTLIFFMIFNGFLWRAAYMVEVVQALTFERLDAIFPVFAIIYSLLRMIIFCLILKAEITIFEFVEKYTSNKINRSKITKSNMG